MCSRSPLHVVLALHLGRSPWPGPYVAHHAPYPTPSSLHSLYQLQCNAPKCLVMVSVLTDVLLMLHSPETVLLMLSSAGCSTKVTLTYACFCRVLYKSHIDLLTQAPMHPQSMGCRRLLDVWMFAPFEMKQETCIALAVSGPWLQGPSWEGPALCQPQGWTRKPRE